MKDIDFEHRAIVVRSGKGRKGRVVTLPDELVVPLKRHLQSDGRTPRIYTHVLQQGGNSQDAPHHRPAEDWWRNG